MTNRLAICFVIASAVTSVSRRGAADAVIQIVFDTVDSVEIKNQDACNGCSTVQSVVVVTGIPSGSSTRFTRSFNFGLNNDIATRCEHLAVIAMSKPGKYQFGIGADTFNAGAGHGDCKLILVTP